ncbi:MAG: hypothetical protein L3J89_06905 [Gammaproteobacteria bacterium]|nr:hypothetical protein [Gammaproteobacteria bacterium]
MKHILLIAILGMFTVGCATVKEQVSEKSSDNQKVLIECTDKGTDSLKDAGCVDAAKIEGKNIKKMME